MTTNGKAIPVDQLLAEADELIRQIHADAINEMEEEHRLQFEIHAQKLERIKSDVQGRIDKKNAAKTGSGAEGMHEAILSIVKAMRGFKKSLSG